MVFTVAALLEHLAKSRDLEWYQWVVRRHDNPDVWRCRCGRHVLAGYQQCSVCGRPK